jgi:hypothetical protein
MARITERDDWFDLWYEDKESILETMVRNMAADLNAGYDYFGVSIRRQRKDIEAYKDQMNAELDQFKTMGDAEVNRWCFYDMKKRGAIA